MNLNMFDKAYFQDGEGSNYKDYVAPDKEQLEKRLVGFKPIIDLCFRYINTPNKALILGGACGYEAMIMKKYGVITAVNMDGSKYAIRNSFHQPSVLHDITQTLPFGMTSFGLVYCGDVLEHIEEEKQEGIAEEIARVCKNNLFMTMPTTETIQWHGDDITHITIKPHQWWVDLYSPWFRLIPTAPNFINSRSYFIMEKKE